MISLESNNASLFPSKSQCTGGIVKTMTPEGPVLFCLPRISTSTSNLSRETISLGQVAVIKCLAEVKRV